MFAEIDAQGWVLIIGAASAFFGNVTAILIGFVKIWHMAKVAQATHTLVNSNMGVALREKAIYARRVADLTINTPEHDVTQKLAADAEELLAEHELKQARVDRGQNTPI